MLPTEAADGVRNESWCMIFRVQTQKFIHHTRFAARQFLLAAASEPDVLFSEDAEVRYHDSRYSFAHCERKSLLV